MSTRSNIARRNLDGSVEFIYCHLDGYPVHHGPILLSHYAGNCEMGQLLELGDLSSLGAEIGQKHDFDDHKRVCGDPAHPHYQEFKRQCNAYGRDRGETGTGPRQAATLRTYSAGMRGSVIKWVYLWDVTAQRWMYRALGSKRAKWVPLADWREHLEEE